MTLESRVRTQVEECPRCGEVFLAEMRQGADGWEMMNVIQHFRTKCPVSGTPVTLDFSICYSQCPKCGYTHLDSFDDPPEKKL